MGIVKVGSGNTIMYQLIRQFFATLSFSSLASRWFPGKAIVAVLALVLVAAACSSGSTSGASSSTSQSVPDATSLKIDANSTVESSESAVTQTSPEKLPEPASRLLYVSLSKDNALVVAEISAEGELSMTGAKVDLGGRGGAVAYGRATQRLYVGASNAIAAVSVADKAKPTFLGVTDVVGEPVYMSLANNETSLITAYFGDKGVSTHAISEATPYEQTHFIETGEQPHAAIFAPSSSLIYVPHRNGNKTSWIDVGVDGSLTAAGELVAETDSNGSIGPRHIAFTPNGKFAYVVNEMADSVSSYSVSGDGSLTLIETISTLPEGYDGSDNTGADIHVTPNGKFVYSSNRGHDSLAMFAVEADGTLKPLGHEPTEARPREFDVSPDGQFLVAAGQDSDALASYRINADGTLTAVSTLAVGSGPVWVTID